MSGECRHSGDCARPPSCTGLCPEVVSTLELCSQKSPRRSLRQQQRAKRSVCLAEVKLWRRSMADIHYPFLGGPFHDRPTETAASLRCRKWWRACAWPGCDHKFLNVAYHSTGWALSGRALNARKGLPGVCPPFWQLRRHAVACCPQEAHWRAVWEAGVGLRRVGPTDRLLKAQ